MAGSVTPPNRKGGMMSADTCDPGVDERQGDLVGLVFPVIKVRFAGPTNTLGSRYIATCRGIRATHSYDHALSASENAYRAARKCWGAYQTSNMVNITHDPRLFIPGDLSDDAYAFTAVPAAYLN